MANSGLYPLLPSLRSTALQETVKMSDQGDAPTPSAAPAPPAGRPPKVGHRGRASGPTDSDNFETADIPELEYFVAPGPRGYPPLTGEGP